MGWMMAHLSPLRRGGPQMEYIRITTLLGRWVAQRVSLRKHAPACQESPPLLIRQLGLLQLPNLAWGAANAPVCRAEGRGNADGLNLLRESGDHERELLAVLLRQEVADGGVDPVELEAEHLAFPKGMCELGECVLDEADRGSQHRCQRAQ